MLAKTSEAIFGEIRALYEAQSDIDFEKRVTDYFYNNFFAAAIGEGVMGIVLSDKEKLEFDNILQRAANKLKKETEAAKTKESRSKRALLAVCRFIGDLSTLGLWRLFKTKSSEKQFTNLVKYSQKLAAKEVAARTMQSFPRSKSHQAESLFKEYSELLDQQILEGRYDTPEAMVVRNGKLEEIKAKLKTIDREVSRSVLETAQDRFSILSHERLNRTAKAKKTIKELDKEISKYPGVIAREYNPAQALSTFDADLKKLRSMLQENIPTEFIPLNKKQLLSRSEALGELLKLYSESESLAGLEELKSALKEIQESASIRTEEIKSLTEIAAALDKINSPEEVLISEKELSARKTQVREALEKMREEQRQLIQDHEKLSIEIANRRKDLEELQQRMESDRQIVTKYKTRVDALLKEMTHDRKESLASLRKALTDKLNEEIKPVRGAMGEYTEQRDAIVKVIVDAVIKKIEEEPSITSDYLSKTSKEHVKINESKMVNVIVTAVAEDARKNLAKWRGRSNFEREAAEKADSIVETTTQNIARLLVVEVRTKEKEEESTLSDFKEHLSQKLTEKIHPYSSPIFGAYIDERDAVVQAIVEEYTKALQEDFLLTSKSHNAQYQRQLLQSIDPPKEEIAAFLAKYALKNDPEGKQVQELAKAMARRMAAKAVEQVQVDPVRAAKQVEHRRRWTEVMAQVKSPDAGQRGRK